MTNEFGLDYSYFKKKLKLIVRDAERYSTDEMIRELSKLTEVAKHQKTLFDEDTLATRIKRRRKELKLSQQSLAVRCDLTQQSIHEIETGNVKRTAFIVEIAAALGVTAEYLVKGDGKTGSKTDLAKRAISCIISFPRLRFNVSGHATKLIRDLDDGCAVTDTLYNMIYLTRMNDLRDLSGFIELLEMLPESERDIVDDVFRGTPIRQEKSSKENIDLVFAKIIQDLISR